MPPIITPRNVALGLAIVSSILLTTAWISVTLRVLVRRSIKGYGLDDTFMVGGLVSRVSESQLQG
jgi:hypothetical protein